MDKKCEWIDLDLERPEYVEGMSPFEIRDLYHQEEVQHEVTIVMVTWNNVEKTKLSVKYLLEHTSHIPFHLVFFDNGSTDDTLDYLKTVDYPDKTIIASKHNMGAMYATNYVTEYLLHEHKSKYLVDICNDCIVTTGWLDNFLACMESDLSIGAVSGATTNMNVESDPRISYESIEELQEIAKTFNKQDPKKWHSTNIIPTAITMLRCSMVHYIGGLDCYFTHYGGDNDLNKRVSRGGYQQVVCFDTLIHHNHVVVEKYTKERSAVWRSAERQYMTIYDGQGTGELKATEAKLLSMGDFSQKGEVKALGINVSVGSPLYTLKYQYQLQGNKEVTLSAYTTKAKYYHDLHFICPKRVACDRIMYLSEHYETESMDCIVLGEPINAFPDPVAVFQMLLSLLKPKGQLFFKSHNYRDCWYYQRLKEGNDVAWMERKMQLPEFMSYLQKEGISYLTKEGFSTMYEERQKELWDLYGATQEMPEEDRKNFFMHDLLCYYRK